MIMVKVNSVIVIFYSPEKSPRFAAKIDQLQRPGIHVSQEKQVTTQQLDNSDNISDGMLSYKTRYSWHTLKHLVSAFNLWSLGPGFEFSWRPNSALDSMELHCTEPSHRSSPYYLTLLLLNTTCPVLANSVDPKKVPQSWSTAIPRHQNKETWGTN